MIDFPVNGSKRRIYTLVQENARGRSTSMDVVLLNAHAAKGLKDGFVRVEEPNGFRIQVVSVAALTATTRFETPGSGYHSTKRARRPRRDEDRVSRRDQRRQKREQNQITLF